MRVRSSRNTEIWGRFLLVVAVAATLAACGEVNRNKDDREHTSLWKTVAPGEAPVLLPKSAPAMVGARTHHEILGYDTWELVFANASDIPGENRLTIDVVPEDESPLAILSHEKRPFLEPMYNPDTLAEALRREFPGASAGTPSQTGRRGRYGVYDYTAVRKGANTCVLAWQMIDDKKRILPASIERIRLEWRFCGPGIDPAPLLEPFEKATLSPDLGILPVDDAVKGAERGVP